MAAHRTVLVAGTQGVIGRAAAGHIAMQADTKVYGLSRRTGADLAGVEEISVDLLQLDDVRSKLGAISNVTHIIFGATSGFDNISSTIKARRAGFQACIDTEDMFTAFFDRLRAQRVLPHA